MVPAKILVVDDDHALLRSMRRSLSSYDVATVDDARTALTVLRAGASFDLIITDLEMPFLDGRAFYEALQREHPEHATRVIFITGATGDAAIDAFLETAPAQLRKPFGMTEIRELIERLLTRRGGEETPSP